MRVIAGAAKGRRLQVPRGLAVRPTASRVRESAFGILEHRGAISGKRVLDLFAGSGALACEALSRGAASVVAVEQDRAVAQVLAENLERCGFGGQFRVVVAPVEVGLRRLPEEAPFDLVLIDPPYGRGLVEPALECLLRRRLLARGAIVLIEHRASEDLHPAPEFGVLLDRRYGDTQLTLLEAPAPRGAGEVLSDGQT
jgi:16S rRNA (guanine966-N2)-methyltransferase